MNHLVRSTDPITSHMAASGSRKFAESHAQRIDACIRKYGRATAKQVSDLTGLTVVQIDRRLPELQRAGQVRVFKVDGADFIHNGFRVWEAV